jgi:sulfur carrier protein
MEIKINGEIRSVPDLLTVAGLVELLGYTGKRIAVERNGEIVPKSLHADTLLMPGDQLEIVVAVGGG